MLQKYMFKVPWALAKASDNILMRQESGCKCGSVLRGSRPMLVRLLLAKAHSCNNRVAVTQAQDI